MGECGSGSMGGVCVTVYFYDLPSCSMHNYAVEEKN